MINEDRYHELCIACRKLLLKEDASITRVAIPWLHVIREHPVILRKYESLFTETSNLIGLLRQGKVLFINWLIWLRQCLRAILSNGKPWVSVDGPPRQTDILFISHYMNKSQLGDSADFYFTDIPNQLLARGRTVGVGLIDQINKGVNSTEISKTNIPRYFFSNTLSLAFELQIKKMLRLEAKRLKALAQLETDSFVKKLALHASKEAKLISAHATLRLAFQLEILIKHTQPKVIITTYEGHAFERITFAIARHLNPDIKCVAYQHTGVFRLSNAIRHTLKDDYNPDYIFTSGIDGKEQLEREENLRGIPLAILGSSRGVIDVSNCVIPLKERKPYTCLVLPEGLESEVIILFQFSLRCALLHPSIKFIWRLHPLITFDSLKSILPSFRKLPPNVSLSNGSLDSDIEASCWVLYRGTTAVYKSISGGLRPVYLKQPCEMTIDPLYSMKSWRTVVESEYDFKKCVDSDISEEFNHSSDYLALSREICEKKFSITNIQVLESII